MADADLPAVIVDTNVPIAANARSTHVSKACKLSCIAALRETQSARRTLLDDGLRILREYQSHLSFAGQPGVGDAFFKWLWDNQANTQVCRKVAITIDPDASHTFLEFPRDPSLKGFDSSDHKFVAVVRASGEDAPVINATDSDWWNFRDALARNGVRVEFICPDMMPA